MKLKLLSTLIMMAGLLSAGCLVRTVEPWLTDETRTTTPSLAGAWQDANAKLSAFFTLQGSNYQIRLVQDGKDTSLLAASLHQVDGTLLLVAGPGAPSTKLDAFVQMPVYLLFKVVLNNDTLQIYTLNLDVAPERIRASSAGSAFFGGKGKGFLLTAPTPALHALVRTQLSSPDFFQTQAVFTFKKMAPATP